MKLSVINSGFKIMSHGRVGHFVSTALALVFAISQNLYALPQDGQVQKGNVVINAPNQNQMMIEQKTQRAIVDWKSFNISSNEKVQFIQPSSSSMILNRITGNDPSKIYGQINANGGVMLINQNGILFGQNSKVDVASLIASTANISNEDFMSGNLHMMKPSNSNAKIINEGTINVKEGGLVALVSPNIQNNGVIIAKYGKIALAGSDTATIDLYGDDLIVFEATSKVKNSIDNNSFIEGSYVAMSVNDAKDVVDSSINMNGIVKAQNIDTTGGKILLTGGDITLNGTLDATGSSKGGDVLVIADMKSGLTNFQGKIDVSSKDEGGFVETSGANVLIGKNAKVDAKAKKMGEWLIDPNDYTIASSDGDVTGKQISDALENSNVTISTELHGHNGLDTNGDIFVYDNIIWNANTVLKLSAQRDIIIASDIIAHGESSGINLDYTGDYKLYDNAKITFDNISSNANQSIVIGGHHYKTLKNIEDIQNISDYSSDKFVMLNDIINENRFVPINGFYGNFEGFGHTIKNLKITGISDIGFFSTLWGEVSNLNFENPIIRGNYGVGVLAGQNFGQIDSVSVIGGNVFGTTTVGGLVGVHGTSTLKIDSVSNDYIGIITNSNSSADVTGAGVVGGLVGQMSRGRTKYTTDIPMITNSSSSGNVLAEDIDMGSIGGFIGVMSSGIIDHSSATGNVESSTYNVGGFVGDIRKDGSSSNIPTILNSVSTGNINGFKVVGGFIGYNFAGNIRNSFSLGGVSGDSYIGGFAGENQNLIESCFSVGNTIASNQTNAMVGGFVGINSGFITKSSSYGNVESTQPTAEFVGGFAGVVMPNFDYTNIVSISNSVAYGDVQSQGDFTGGFIGSVQTIDTHANFVKVKFNNILATGEILGVGEHVNGIFGGTSYGNISDIILQNSYYDYQTGLIGDANSEGAKTTAELKNPATFTGWDIDTTGLDTSKIWNMSEFSSYPELFAYNNTLLNSGYHDLTRPTPTSVTDNSISGLPIIKPKPEPTVDPEPKPTVDPKPTIYKQVNNDFSQAMKFITMTAPNNVLREGFVLEKEQPILLASAGTDLSKFTPFLLSDDKKGKGEVLTGQTGVTYGGKDKNGNVIGNLLNPFDQNPHDTNFNFSKIIDTTGKIKSVYTATLSEAKDFLKSRISNFNVEIDANRKARIRNNDKKMLIEKLIKKSTDQKEIKKLKKQINQLEVKNKILREAAEKYGKLLSESKSIYSSATNIINKLDKLGKAVDIWQTYEKASAFTDALKSGDNVLITLNTLSLTGQVSKFGLDKTSPWLAVGLDLLEITTTEAADKIDVFLDKVHFDDDFWAKRAGVYQIKNGNDGYGNPIRN